MCGFQHVKRTVGLAPTDEGARIGTVLESHKTLWCVCIDRPFPTLPLVGYPHGNDRPPNGATLHPSRSLSPSVAVSPSATRTHVYTLCFSLSVSVNILFFLSNAWISPSHTCEKLLSLINAIFNTQLFSTSIAHEFLLLSAALLLRSSSFFQTTDPHRVLEFLLGVYNQKWVLPRNQSHYRFACTSPYSNSWNNLAPLRPAFEFVLSIVSLCLSTQPYRITFAGCRREKRRCFSATN